MYGWRLPHIKKPQMLCGNEIGSSLTFNLITQKSFIRACSQKQTRVQGSQVLDLTFSDYQWSKGLNLVPRVHKAFRRF